ncbi:27107_t:CDS:2, partial [Dentiscutata erythropus]
FVVIFAALLLSEKVSCQNLLAGSNCTSNNPPQCLSNHCESGFCALGIPGDPCHNLSDCISECVACTGTGNTKTCHSPSPTIP